MLNKHDEQTPGLTQPKALSPGYTQLVISHQSSIYAFIQSLVPGDESVDDILQETNITLCAKEEGYEMGSNFKAFAFKIAQFKVLSHLRDKKRHRWLLADSELCDQLLETMVESPVSPDDSHDKLRRCINRLPQKQRQLLMRRYRDGYTVRDLSRMSKRSETSMQQLFYRMRHAIKECMTSLAHQ